MSILYFDSSALAKQYLEEKGTPYIQTLLEASSGHTILINELTRIEVAAAIAARQRASDGISIKMRDDAINLLLNNCLNQYSLIPITAAILDRAFTLTQQHRLHGYDAIQLAVALYINEQYKQIELPELTLIAAADDLLLAAQNEGLATANPNDHAE